MKSFNIPFHFESDYIKRIKTVRSIEDKRKKDFSPTLLELPSQTFALARHFGFCFGVQNAVEKAYQIIEKNPNKNIFLISEIIHNPEVNADLESKGLRFIQNTKGEQLIPWENISSEDIVIIPAFGVSVEILEKLQEIGVLVEEHDTTCPFVERVWNKGNELASEDFTTVIHGTFHHEETRATLSRASKNGKAVVVQNMNEAKILAAFMKGGGLDERDWGVYFKWQASPSFNFRKDLDKIGVINQTTMLASETQEIADYLKTVLIEKHGEENIDEHFGSTRDTLCYATNDNQSATAKLLDVELDLIFVIGGYNSSNTTHLAEMLESPTPVYFIASEKEILSESKIKHFDFTNKEVVESSVELDRKGLKIGLTAGASCPDATIERVMLRLISFVGKESELETAIQQLEQQTNGL